MGVLPACVCVLCLCSACGGQKRASRYLELKLDLVVSARSQTPFSGGAGSALDHCIIFPAPTLDFLSVHFWKIIKTNLSGTVLSFDFSFNILSLHVVYLVTLNLIKHRSHYILLYYVIICAVIFCFLELYYHYS